ncbi:MAG: enoyl-CoA hydratase/isomerase family protein [Pseudomonadota bacterium]
MDDVVTYETQGAVACLTLNRPRAMNALNLSMLLQLEQHLARICADVTLRVLILTGAGGAFCAGADLKEVLAGAALPPGDADFLDRCSAVFGMLRDFPKPVIVALNGVTMAGGLELAMCADIIVAADSATIADAHANFGVFPGAGGAAVLPRLIPLNMAMYLLLSGKALSACAMQACGLVCEVHPDAELAEATLKLAKKIAQHSPVALRRMKEVARNSADKRRADALLHEQVMLREHLRSADLQEGLQAFAEKRKPAFQGR